MDKVGKKVRKRAKEKPFLPDEILISILIRLPVQIILRFGHVCRKWRDITLSRDFADLHLKSGIPVIIVATTSSYLLEFCAVDKWWDLARTMPMIHTFPFCAADFRGASIQLSSHDGLIVLKGYPFHEPEFIILNPLRPSYECVKINFSEDFRGDICAVYYHPSLKEYCALWKLRKPGPDQPIQYKFLNLGSNPSLKTICNPFDYRVNDEDAYPLFINNHLYWMLRSEKDYKFGGHSNILEFDIISEEFTIIPCPIPLNIECVKQQTHLLNSDGAISLILILPSTINVWRLEDHVQKLWTSTEYTTRKKLFHDFYHDFYAVNLIAIFDGKLAFELGGILFVGDLMEGTRKKYPKRYIGDVLFMSRKMSLTSLKKCKSALYINKDGLNYALSLYNLDSGSSITSLKLILL